MVTACRGALLGSIALGSALAAQTPPKDSVPNVASLRAPSLPAFVLLGISPSDVARPQAPADFGLNLANSAAAVSQLPQDVAMETAPYWLFPHPALRWQNDVTRSVGNSLLRTFALSFGTTEKRGIVPPTTKLGVGARTMLFSGHLTEKTVKLLNGLDSSAAAQGHIFNRFRQPETERIDALQAVELAPCASIADAAARGECALRVTRKFQALRDSVTKAVRANPEYQREIAAAEKAIDDFSLAREGFMWELAGGAVWDFADGVWVNHRLTRSGAWTTMSYEGGKLGNDGTTWAPVIVARYLKEDTTNAWNIADVGGRFVASGPQYALSVEYVQRFWSGDNAPSSQHRLAGMIEYKVRDDTWLFGAIGRDYADATRDSFISRFGVSFSFKKERYKPPKS